MRNTRHEPQPACDHSCYACARSELDEAKKHGGRTHSRVNMSPSSAAWNVEEAALTREMTMQQPAPQAAMTVSMPSRDGCRSVGRRSSEALIACQVAAAEVDHARTVLTLSRAGHRSVEMLMEKQTLQTAAGAAIRTQREMDDLALRLRSA